MLATKNEFHATLKHSVIAAIRFRPESTESKTKQVYASVPIAKAKEVDELCFKGGNDKIH
jgi:hypothetical protein